MPEKSAPFAEQIVPPDTLAADVCTEVQNVSICPRQLNLEVEHDEYVAGEEMSRCRCGKIVAMKGRL